MFQITFLIFIYFFNVCYSSEEEAWYSYQKEFQNGNREELVIKSVKSEDNIHINHNVSKWKSLSIGSICYSIGLSSNGIVKLSSTLNSEGTAFNVSTEFLELEDVPSDVVLVNYLVHDKSEVIAIVIYQNERKMDWLVLSRKMEFRTFWTGESLLYHVNVFKRNDKVLLATIGGEEQNVSLTVYNMNLRNQDIQLSPLTSVDIAEIASSSAFLHTNEIVYFAVPQTQTGKVVIYKILNDTLVEHDTIKSSEVTDVTAFQISFRCFLTVNGHNSGIYEFTEHGITRQNLVHGNIDSIHFWLPVPVQTYRDEVILLAERALEHDTHTSCTVEIIVNNGGKFEEHEDIPCTHVGESVEWLTCLSHDFDIAGSNYILVDDKLGIIVPQENENLSEIFMIEYEIVNMPHPKEQELQKMVALKEKLKKMIELQQKRIQEFKTSKQPPILKNANIQSGEKTLTSMNHAQLFDLRSKLENIGSQLKIIKEKMNDTVRVNSTYDTIIINNRAEFKGKVVVENLNFQRNFGEDINDLLNDIVNKSNLTKIPGKKTFTDLEAKNITFQKLNNIEADSIILSNVSPITLTGSATFKHPLEVQNINILSNRIKEISLDDIVVLQGKYNGELKFANISVTDTFSVDKLHGQNNSEFRSLVDLESLFLPLNATVKFINGKSLDGLLNDMCLINVKCYIPKNLTVTGNITTEESFTDFLNDLRFPDNFLFVDSSSHANITGKKIFKNSLKAEEITTRGTVDNVNFSKIITLSTDQEIPGKIIFEQLQLTEILNVTGNVTGDDMDKFLPKPTLNETDIVHSNVIFNRLEVEGDIIIENNFNNQPFNDTLNDLVYKENEDVDISGIKTFPNGIEAEDLTIKSGMINNIKLEDLVTKHKDENLFNISHLKGDVTIKNLFVNGTFNGFNITELDESLVKLTGEQFIESTLIFHDELTVQNLEISEKLNDHKFDDYLYATGDYLIDWDVSLDTLNAENVSVEGNFVGDILENNLTLLSDRYLSYTKNQTIDVPFEIRLSEVENLEATKINDFEIGNVNGLNKDLAERISKGLIEVENLEVTGSLNINEANGQVMADLFGKYPIKLDKFKKNLTVEGDVYFKEVTIKKLSGVSWERLLKLLVFKNETNLVLNGTKTFQNDFTVKKLVETKKINNISLENILTTKGKQDVKGPILIVGNVTFQKLDVKESLNEVDVNDIFDNLEISNNTYTIKSDVVFQRLAYIDDLNLKGKINQKNPEHTLNQIVFLDEDFVLKGPLTFHNTVNVSGNISIENFNGDVFPDYSNFVFVNDPAIITGRIIFNESVLLSEKLLIAENLNTTLLSGLNTTDWLEKAIFVNKGLLTGTYGFENITINENFIVKFLNHQNMSSLIDLRVGQFINHMKFGEIKAINNIPVGNLVNGYKLAEELNNTLMANANQTVNSNIIFKSPILVRENLSVETLNKHDASRIVTTNKNQNLSSPFNFKSKCSLSSNLKVHGLLNGINPAHLNKNLKSFSSDVQEVENDWNVLKNVTFNDVLECYGVIENLNLTSIVAEVEQRTNYKYQTEGGNIETYNALCTDIKHLQKAAQNQLYRFRYFDSLQEISFNDNLKNMFSFEFSDNKYLLVNEDGCMSHTFIFNSTMFYPMEFGIVTGQIDQIVPVNWKNKRYLVTRSTSDQCLVRGTNIWELRENTLELKHKMEDLELIQDSLVPGTFYGLDSEGVTEYKINDVEYRKYRQWKISEDNMAFFPRGLSGTGLALRTGDKIIFLQRTDPIVDEEDLDINTHTILRGSVQLTPNTAVPGRSGMDMVILHVGTKGTEKTFLAVANLERTTVGGHTNIIKIYDDPLRGGIFQEIRSYKPSSLVSLEFEQGETLLAFLEDNKILQVYEYKGIEGFKHLSTIKLQGTKLVPMTLQITPYLNPRKALGVLDGNKVKIIQAVMMGNRLEENFDCQL